MTRQNSSRPYPDVQVTYGKSHPFFIISDLRHRLGRAAKITFIVFWMSLLIISGQFFAARTQIVSAQSGADANNPAQSEGDVRLLEPVKPVEREIAAGQSHHYLLDLVEGQYARLALEKKSADLVLVVSRPDGEKITEAKSSSPQAPLGVVLLASVSGKHRIEVRSLAKDGAPAPYKLSIAELRTATEEDHNRVAAAKAYTEGLRLVEKGDEQSLRDSIEKFQEAMSLFKAIGKRKDEAVMLDNIGSVYQRLKNHQEAIRHYLQALPIYKEIGERGGEASMLYKIGQSWNALGEKQKAIEYLSEALPLYHDLGNRSFEAGLIVNLARLYESSDDIEKALDLYNQAAALYHAVGDRSREANAILSIGRVYGLLGEYRKSIEYYDESLSLYRAVGDRNFEAVLLNLLAGIHTSLNEYQEALLYFDQSLLIFQALKNQRGEAIVLNGLGRIHSSLGDYQKALNYLNRALPALREVGDRPSEATTLYSMGEASMLSGEYGKALEYYGQALSLYRSLRDRRREASTLNGIASVYSLQNENRKALEYYNQALTFYRATDNRHGEAAALNNIGRVHLSLGEAEKSLEFHKQALSIIRDVKDRRGEGQMLYNIARAHIRRGDLSAARSHSQEAVALAESLRHEVSSQQLRASLFASVRDYYDLNIDALMQLHQKRPSEGFDHIALEVSERARARSLLELLAEARADIRRGADPELLEREQSLNELLNVKSARQTQLLSGKHTPEQASAATKEIESLLTERQQVQARIRAKSPQYASLTHPQPASLKDIQRQVLDRDTLLLEYALSHERSYMWAVSQDSITSYELPKREDIEEAARRFYELLRRGDSGREERRGRGDAATRRRGELEEAALQLSRMLLAPVADRLGAKRLVIVADGILHYIPFAALPLPETQGDDTPRVPASPRPRVAYKPLILKNEIVTLPSASILAEMRKDLAGRKPAANEIAVFADPVFTRDDPRLASSKGVDAQTDETVLTGELERALRDLGAPDRRAGFRRLLFSRREAEAIASVAPKGRILKSLDFQASRAAATADQLSDYRIVHFATHGLLNSSNPDLSGIVLSLFDWEGRPQNGFLRLHEIYNLKLPAELVVLSACQTALGKEIRGEGLVGLTRGFMYAGAARVVASLWKVDDAATAELMKRFYTGMFVKKLRPAAALREAQVEMWKQERWRQPYYWASFELQGEWR